jgi:hypothetical protein
MKEKLFRHLGIFTIKMYEERLERELQEGKDLIVARIAQGKHKINTY